MRLSKTTALIPGASRPIGRAIANVFGKKGAKLYLPVFDWPDSITDLEKDFQKKEYNFSILKTDLRDQNEVIKLKKKVESDCNHLDYLINNIERGGMPIIHGSYNHPHNAEQWDLEFDTTVKAKYLLYDSFLPLLKMAHSPAIVNISSIASEIGRSGPCALLFNDGYSAANRAIYNLTKTWAKENAPSIRVNELMLGIFQHRHGEHTRGWGELSNTEKKEIIERIPLNRTGTIEEAAKTVFFLAVEATYMTGSILYLDGGISLGPDQVPPIPPGVLSSND